MYISNLSTIADRYDALLLDLWGVVHDGTHLYPGVHGALTELRKAGKKIIMLSNAPRRASKVEKVLNGLGIEPGLYDAVVSSGEVGYQWLASGQNTLGKHYYYIGPDKDLDVTDGLDFTQVKTIPEAEFLLNVGFGSEEQNASDWTEILQQAKGRGLTMVCLNPDLEVVKLTGERFPCAGVLAQDYERLGGKVIWFGKPYGAVYEECLNSLSLRERAGVRDSQHTGTSNSRIVPHPLDANERQALPEGEGISKSRILAIGDSLDTDIRGAADFGIDSVLITGGILKNHTAQEIEKICRVRNISPTYMMPSLR